MARPTLFPGWNVALRAPPGKEDSVQTLYVFNNGQCSVSCWVLDDDEIAELKRNGGKLFLSVWGGKTQPPVFVGTERTVRSCVAQHGGVWSKDNETKTG